jgi:hypothetical protein
MQELQELLLSMGELRGRMKIRRAGSIRGLLRRNPTAVSHTHRESFADLKKSLSEKVEEIKK